MIVRFIVFTLLPIFCGVYAQVLYSYPKDQEFYNGGRKNFYRELQEIVIKIM